MAATAKGLLTPSINARIEVVQHFALFDGVVTTDCAAIITEGREKRLYRRQNLFSVGDPIDQLLQLSLALQLLEPFDASFWMQEFFERRSHHRSHDVL